jgi:pheromone shutdown-related protein TraB
LENLEEKKEDAVLPCQIVVPMASGSLTDGESHEIIIVGTAHVSEKSVQEVVSKIEEVRPDIVAVELCPARYRALTGQEEEKEIKIGELLSGGRLSFFLVQLFLAYIQRKIGDEMGVKPGSEMLAAIEAAKRTGARVALVDRDVGITIQRFWAAMGFWGKIKLIGSLIPAAIGWGEEEIDIDSITQEDIVSQLIGEFRKISPGAANALVDERDAYLARNLILLSKQGRVLAVVGAGHREGITKHLAHPEDIPAIEGLNEKPGKKRITFVKVFGVLISLLVLAIVALVLIVAQSSHNGLQAAVIWFFVTGGLSALGVLLAGGHPLSALTALMVAWLTTLIPFIAAGWFAGMVEAWKIKPTVADLKRLAQADSFKQMMQNRLGKVILVTALSNLGAMAGVIIAGIIFQRMGLIDPNQMWSLAKGIVTGIISRIVI